MTSTTDPNETEQAPAKKLRLSYAVVWRWHFYAGLFCMPFVLWLALTGPIYLFKPQIDAFIDRPYDSLQYDGPAAAPSAQVKAALESAPGAGFNAYELPTSPNSAARVLVRRGDELIRVYVHPQSLQILHSIPDASRFTRMLFYLHGELMLGTSGSMLVELAASWAIVMIVTGIFLWWPREAKGFGGLLYPRLNLPDRAWWKDLHSVIGFWVAAFTLFLLISGLPWAASWGGMLKSVRQIGASAPIQQDWTTGSASEKSQARAEGGEHAGHHRRGGAGVTLTDAQFAEFDRIAPNAASLGMAAPVLITPPNARNPKWTARSDAEKRPLRETASFDASTGSLVERKTFAQRPFIDRLVGYGVAIHVGQMFGWLNVALGVFTGLGLITVSVSGLVMWLKRRPQGKLGAPARALAFAPGLGLLATLVALGLLLPLLGATLLLVLALDRWVLPRIPPVARFMGLGSA